jgi:hypothetical protein
LAVAEDGGLVELEGVVVPQARLAPDAPGIDDSSLQAAVDTLAGTPFGESAPQSGWRVLRNDGKTAVVAAYDVDWLGWTIVTFTRSAMEWQPQQSSHGVKPRPTAAVRGRGFTLSFAESVVVARSGEQPAITVMLRNGSDQPWRETTYGWARGYLNDIETGQRLPNEDAVDSTLGQCDLYVVPGGSTELPVRLLTRDVESLPPGEYSVTVSYPELALHATDGRLHIIE